MTNTETTRRVCRRCHEDAIAHCFDCGACPEQECPEWCEHEE